MAAAAILKNRQIAISPQPFDRFWRNLVTWRVWALRALPSFKIRLYQCAKFGWNRPSSFANMQVFLFYHFGLKILIHAPQNGGFGGIWPPKWGAISTKPQQGTSLVEAASFGAIARQNRSMGLTCGGVSEKKVYLYIYTVSQKTPPTFLRCNSSRRCWILIIFGINV